MEYTMHYLAKGQVTICAVGSRQWSHRYMPRLWTDKKEEVTCKRCLSILNKWEARVKK
jgi:hypothetical protein